jgi:hypothetical protein
MTNVQESHTNEEDQCRPLMHVASGRAVLAVIDSEALHELRNETAAVFGIAPACVRVVVRDDSILVGAAPDHRDTCGWCQMWREEPNPVRTRIWERLESRRQLGERQG